MKQLRFSEWAEFGWHGIGLTVPAGWNPGKIEGDAKSGSVRMDDGEIVRLELEWKDARGDDRIGLIVDRYVEGLAKNAQKQNSALQVERRADCPGLHLPEMRSVEYFVWHSSLQVHTLVCHSPTTDRLIFLRVMGRPHEGLKGLLPQLLNSLCDSPADGPQRWAIYDLIFSSPAGHELEDYELKSGHIRFHFRHESNKLQIDRLGLAGILLKDQSLSDWYRDFFRKELRHVVVDITEASTNGHPGILVRAKPQSRWRGLIQPLPFWRVRPRLHLEGRIWNCPESNRIYVVQSHHKKPEEAPDVVAWCREVICHQDTETL